MQTVLYTPGLGYYVAGKYKFGTLGDFVTAPEISPLFSMCIAKQCQQVLKALVNGDILEFGAGSGVMASAILTFLATQHSLPQHYFILEPSPDLQALQRATLQAKCPELLIRVQWLSALPQQFTGIMLANEVLDAFPVKTFHWDGQRYRERCVAYDAAAEQFIWQDRDLITPSSLTTALHTLPQQNFADHYLSEISLLIKPWLFSLNDSLQRGIILLIDYGFPRSEYYHSQRNQGTLMCHHQHRAHDDPFIHIGLQDISAHVDFTLIAEVAKAANLVWGGYTNQANFLLNCDILSLYQQFLPGDAFSKVNVQQQLNRLIQPQEMGELCKFAALMRGLDLTLLGFEHHDKSASLDLIR